MMFCFRSTKTESLENRIKDLEKETKVLRSKLDPYVYMCSIVLETVT